MQTSQKTHPLNGWVTMSQVSNALGIKHNTVRQTVHRALLDQQEWVKRAPYPTPTDPVRWLINTDHAIYQYHERRWKKLAEKTSAEQETVSSKRQSCSTPAVRSQAVEVTETWPELCHWLAERGLVVFVNAIAEDQSWRWTWLDNHGSGYPDATAAITAAVQEQLSEHYPLSLYRILPPTSTTPPATYTTPPTTEPPAKPELPLWNSLFRKKW
jgi:hypothetical protein